MSDFPYIDINTTTAVRRTTLSSPSQLLSAAFMTGVLTFAPCSGAASGAPHSTTVNRVGSVSTSSHSSTFVEVDQIHEEAPTATVALATGEAVRRIRQQSGFTWDELARLFGVSRRTVHAWANGSRLNQAHAQRLGRIVEVVRMYAAPSPDVTRARLLAPGTDGSVYQQLVREIRSTEPAEGVPLEERLGVGIDR